MQADPFPCHVVDTSDISLVIVGVFSVRGKVPIFCPPMHSTVVQYHIPLILCGKRERFTSEYS